MGNVYSGKCPHLWGDYDCRLNPELLLSALHTYNRPTVDSTGTIRLPPHTPSGSYIVSLDPRLPSTLDDTLADLGIPFVTPNPTPAPLKAVSIPSPSQLVKCLPSTLEHRNAGLPEAVKAAWSAQEEVSAGQVAVVVDGEDVYVMCNFNKNGEAFVPNEEAYWGSDREVEGRCGEGRSGGVGDELTGVVYGRGRKSEGFMCGEFLKKDSE